MPKTLSKTKKPKQAYLTIKDKETYKQKIISDLFKSGVIQKKIEGMLFRKKINLDSGLVEDFTSETFLELVKKPADYIISLFEDNANRLVGLSVTIVRRRGLTATHLRYDLPSACWLQNYLHTSNINTETFYSPTEELEEDNNNSYQYILHEDDKSDNTNETISDIKYVLTTNQNFLLEEYFQLTSKKSLSSLEAERVECYSTLLKKIRQKIKQHNLKWN